MNCLAHLGGRARGLGCVFSLLVVLAGLAGCSSNTVRGTSAPAVSRFWVNLRLRPQLQGAAAVRDHAARGQFVVDELRRTAAQSQGPVISFLEQRNVKFKPFWVANVIWVEADEETRKGLAGLPEVESIEPDQEIALDDAMKPMSATPMAAAPIGLLRVEENVRRVHAPEVWDRGITGEGVVVGILDSGFAPHPAINERYRGYQSDGTFSNEHNWLDVTLIRCDSPCDRHGHGTHVTGTIVGRAGEEAIGVAPGAKFIACRAFDEQGVGTIYTVMNCLQWFASPGQHPNIVNMSVETAGSSSSLGLAVNDLEASGTLSVAASGSTGGCGTPIYPAALPNALSVGALTANSATNVVTSYTTKGPGLKPDLVAQGDAVRSSWLNNGYRVMNGTSMASPAVSGVAALVMSAGPRWMNDPAGVADLLKTTANSDVASIARGCQYTGFGYGLVDADAAVIQALR